ncbi:conserved hypothetical protein [Ricinus communis]|uniref:Uncharacterized protein n=1 Tax=Ricinus communis TaxID=3988 RepID=B9TEI4_RICCO|nr:conserved hypothetical protein [Ricinus communis]
MSRLVSAAAQAQQLEARTEQEQCEHARQRQLDRRRIGTVADRMADGEAAQGFVRSRHQQQHEAERHEADLEIGAGAAQQGDAGRGGRDGHDHQRQQAKRVPGIETARAREAEGGDDGRDHARPVDLAGAAGRIDPAVALEGQDAGNEGNEAQHGVDRAEGRNGM